MRAAVVGGAIVVLVLPAWVVGGAEAVEGGISLELPVPSRTKVIVSLSATGRPSAPTATIR